MSGSFRDKCDAPDRGWVEGHSYYVIAAVPGSAVNLVGFASAYGLSFSTHLVVDLM
jgi:hypothetical protein